MGRENKLSIYKLVALIYFSCFSYNDLYSFEFFIRESWFPKPIIDPFFRTKILSALCIVESLWAITKVVLFLTKLDMAFWTTYSESASSDDVASSKRIIEDFFKIALAIDIRCFWPPESLTPFSPIVVSKPLGSLFINSVAAA